MFEAYVAAEEIKDCLKKTLKDIENEKRNLLYLKHEDPEMYIMNRKYTNHKAQYYYLRGKLESYCEIVAILAKNKVAGASLFYPSEINYDPTNFRVRLDEIKEIEDEGL